MINARVPTTRYTIEFIGNPSNNAAKIKALAGDDTMLMAPDHVLAMWLPDALDKDGKGGKVAIGMRELLYLVLGGVALSPDVANGGVHFFIDAARLTKLFVDLDAAGFKWIPIKGNKETAMPQAHKILSTIILNLHIDQRIIDVNDVIYDGPAHDAGTGTFFDWLTPKALITGEGHERHELLSQLVMLFPDYFAKGTATGTSPNGRSASTFTEVIEHILSAVAATGRDVSDLPMQGQMAAVVAWFKRSRPPVVLAPFVIDPYSEIERRTAKTHAERMQTLFVVGWRSAFPTLNLLLPNEEDDISATISSLATSLNVGGFSTGITIEGVQALVTLLKDLVAFAVSDNNADRLTEIVKAHKNADIDKDKGTSAESKLQLQADPDFQALKTDLEQHDITDSVGIALKMMKSNHVGGMLFLNNKWTDQWMKKLNAARCDSAIQTVFNDAVSATKKGESAEWGAVFPEDAGKKLLSGKVDTNWWVMLRNVTGRREGQVVANRIDKRLRGRPAATLYADSEAMRVLEAPIRAIMKLLGFNGSTEGSFINTWRKLIRMAEAIEGLPSACTAANGLKKRLIEVGSLIFKCPQDRIESMLATPPNVAKRVTEFLVDGAPYNAITALDDHIDRILKDVSDGIYGISRDARLNAGSEDDDPETAEGKHKKHKLDDKEVKLSRESKGLGDDLTWGHAAFTHGISVNPTGTIIAFGTQIAAEFEEAPDLEEHCVARFAPSAHVLKRAKWCQNVGKCKKWGFDAHARVEGFPDEKCRAMTKEKFDEIDWDTMSPHGRGGGGYPKYHYSGRGQGNMHRPGQGRGIQKNQGKGGGKGLKGGGKGGKGGKGGGKGGKGRGRGGAS